MVTFAMWGKCNFIPSKFSDQTSTRLFTSNQACERSRKIGGNSVKEFKNSYQFRSYRLQPTAVLEFRAVKVKKIGWVETSNLEWPPGEGREGKKKKEKKEAAILLTLLLVLSFLSPSPPPADPTNLNSVKKPIFPVSV